MMPASSTRRTPPEPARSRRSDAADGRPRSTPDGQARRIVLAGEAIDYRVVRAKRRSIGMNVGMAGLTVRASRWVSIREIEATLAQHSDWILRQLAWWAERRRDVLPQAWKTGAPILYQGRELALALHPAHRKEIAADMLNLTVLHPSPHDEESIAAFVLRWLKDEALRLALPLVEATAARITDSPPSVALSNARNEWGSCNRNGEIRLSWRLVHLPPSLAHYVVAHEVAHLVELNHSPRFWALVERLFPGHAAARRTLQDWTALLE